MTEDCVPVIVTRIVWSSMKRCPQPVNPKRPSWKCKNPPTHLVRWEGTQKGTAVCEQHLAEMTARCPD